MSIPVATLPENLRRDLTLSDLIVFDGECVLCSGFFQFMMRHDREQRFQFVLAQSDLGARLYRSLGLPIDEFETNLVIVDGQIFQKMDAFAQAVRTLGWPCRMLSIVRFFPRVLKNPAYRVIARNRYRIFGRFDTCMMPDAAVRKRFLEGGF